MKRKLLLALIALTCALCLIFALAGCNPAENQSSDNKSDTHNYIFKCSQTEHWQSCTDCGEETAHTPHSVSDGVCPACGYVEKCTEGLKFWEIQENEWEIQENEEIIGYSVSKGTATDSHIFIPSFYNNLPVISIGVSAFYECESFESVTIGNGITSIGDSAFESCTNLEEITIPDGVTYIGNGAFNYTAYCFNADNFKNDVLYIGNYLIGAKYTLSGSYQITSGTKLIADEAFWHCENLTKITIPDSVTYIGGGAFSGCTSLEEITISDSVISIGRSAFWYCESLKEITIPDSVTSIGYGAFSDCTSLENITVDKENKVYRSEGNCLIEKETQTVIVGCKTSKIPEGVTSIGSGAFAGCTSLTEITIPDSVTSIGSDAFYDCTNIKTATMPTLAIIYIPKNNLQTVILTCGDSIGDYHAFSGCKSLTEITIPDSVTYIGSYAFSDCTSLERVNFSDNSNLTFIGLESFVGCTSLTKITIPDSVTSIDQMAFAGCTSLTEITIGNGVTSIGIDAFYKCTSITEITIPDSVTSIDRNAFRECTSLERVIFENTDGWKVSRNSDISNSEDINLSDPEQNAKNLKDKYNGYYWKRGE